MNKFHYKKGFAIINIIVIFIIGIALVITVTTFSKNQIDTSKKGLTSIAKNSLTKDIDETEKFSCNGLKIDECLKNNEGFITCFYGNAYSGIGKLKTQKGVGCYLCDPERFGERSMARLNCESYDKVIEGLSEDQKRKICEADTCNIGPCLYYDLTDTCGSR